MLVASESISNPPVGTEPVRFPSLEWRARIKLPVPPVVAAAPVTVGAAVLAELATANTGVSCRLTVANSYGPWITQPTSACVEVNVTDVGSEAAAILWKIVTLGLPDVNPLGPTDQPEGIFNPGSTSLPSIHVTAQTSRLPTVGVPARALEVIELVAELEVLTAADCKIIASAALGDGLLDADGETEADFEDEGETELEGEIEVDGEIEADGETDADGEREAEAAGAIGTAIVYAAPPVGAAAWVNVPGFSLAAAVFCSVPPPRKTFVLVLPVVPELATIRLA